MNAQLWGSLITPIFLLTILLTPLLYIIVKRYYSIELIPISLINGSIMTGGVLLNIFVFRQLSGKTRNLILYSLIIFSSFGFALGGLVYITIGHPFFFLYGLDVLFSYLIINFIIITSLSLFGCGFFNYQMILDKTRAAQEKEIKLREEMERQIYSSKINPHFLFNSLNLMISLLDNREKAEDVLIGLSDLLRLNLEVSKKQEIPLSVEIDILKKYLFIQKERFGDRLEVEIKGTSDIAVPPLLLQPLVENCIKHNLDDSDFVKIFITIREGDKYLHIDVKDSYARLREDMVGGGTGLEITKQRIQMWKGEFEIREGGINICIPRK